MPNGCNEHNAQAGNAAGRQTRTTFWLETYQVIVRVGWIFKTETIIMPAVLDAVVDSGLLRGLLPVLNRGGQSVPPLFVSGSVARRPVKKWMLVQTSLAMAICFGLLAVAWSPLEASRPDLLALLFLVLYGLFSASGDGGERGTGERAGDCGSAGVTGPLAGDARRISKNLCDDELLFCAGWNRTGFFG